MTRASTYAGRPAVPGLGGNGEGITHHVQSQPIGSTLHHLAGAVERMWRGGIRLAAGGVEGVGLGAVRPGNAEFILDLCIEGLKILVTDRPVIGHPILAADSEIGFV